MNEALSKWLKRKKIFSKKCKDINFRLEVYKNILTEIQIRQGNSWLCGFCFCLPKDFIMFTTVQKFNRLPELKAYKPERRLTYKGKNNYWFDPCDYDIRKNIINKVIKEVEDKISSESK